MTLDKTQELIQVQVDLGGGYNLDCIRIILSEVKIEPNQDTILGLKVGEELYL
jgi:hypothetical protein